MGLILMRTFRVWNTCGPCVVNFLCPGSFTFEVSIMLAWLRRRKRPYGAVYPGTPQAALASEAIATVGHTMRAMNGEAGAKRAAITQGLRGGALAYGMKNKESAWPRFRFFACVLGSLRVTGC